MPCRIVSLRIESVESFQSSVGWSEKSWLVRAMKDYRCRAYTDISPQIYIGRCEVRTR